MKKLMLAITDEKANSLVENVIILPLIFVIIYAIIMTCFIMHDRSTLEAAAKRGAIYAAHCICDPNYNKILRQSGSPMGELDTNINDSEMVSFSGIGNNIQPYRYLTNSSANIKSQVQAEVEAIIKKTRIPWREVNIDDIDFKAINKFISQNITVSIKADYPIASIFGGFGLETDYDIEVTAKMAVNDPDEFIRNADLVVDLISKFDDLTGGHISKTMKKIEEIGNKITDWFAVK